MHDRDYERLERELDTGAISEESFDALAREAERRSDVRVGVLCALTMEDEERATELIAAATDQAVREVVAMLGSWTDVDLAWHALFRIADHRPALMPSVEAVLADWSDCARPIPQVWWDEIRAGQHRPCHWLVRNMRVDAGQASALDTAAARKSLCHLTELELCGAVDPDLEVAARAGLDSVRHLYVVQSQLSFRAVADLVVGESFSALSSLTLASLQPDPPTARLRTGSGRVGPVDPWGSAGLEELGIQDPMPLEGLAAALGGRATRRPRFDLELKALGVDAAGVYALARQRALRGIGTLQFSFCVIGPKEIAILADSENASDLTGLSLHLGHIGELGMRSLGAAPFFPKLRVLNLSGHETGDVFGEELARSGGSALEVLELRHDELGPLTAAAFAAADLGRLVVLDLSYNPLTDRDLARVLSNPTLRVLQRLELLGTGAGEETARVLAAEGHFAALRTLNVGDAFGDAAAAILAGSSALRSLSRLQMRGASDGATRAVREGLGLTRAFVTNAMLA